jgi:ribosomal protein S18 acetylase RimI-like enzyme
MPNCSPVIRCSTCKGQWSSIFQWIRRCGGFLIRHAHIFLLYVRSTHRRQGIAKALIQIAETWAKKRGDRQIGLQVFADNHPAVGLYQSLGYQVESYAMLKRL